MRDLVHGAMFTRGPKDLYNTAIFVGGSDVRAAEAILVEVYNAFLGPMRVSVLFDANGANTTAAAAVLKASRHVDLDLHGDRIGSHGPRRATSGPVAGPRRSERPRRLAQPGASRTCVPGSP